MQIGMYMPVDRVAAMAGRSWEVLGWSGPGDAGGPAQPQARPQSARGHLHEDGTSHPRGNGFKRLLAHSLPRSYLEKMF